MLHAGIKLGSHSHQTGRNEHVNNKKHSIENGDTLFKKGQTLMQLADLITNLKALEQHSVKLPQASNLNAPLPHDAQTAHDLVRPELRVLHVFNQPQRDQRPRLPKPRPAVHRHGARRWRRRDRRKSSSQPSWIRPLMHCWSLSAYWQGEWVSSRNGRSLNWLDTSTNGSAASSGVQPKWRIKSEPTLACV